MSVTVTCPCCKLGEHSCNVTPGTPDVMYLSNGDPGYPGDPPECEIESSTCECLAWMEKYPNTSELHDKLCAAIEECAFESLSDYDDDPRGGDGPDD